MSPHVVRGTHRRAHLWWMAVKFAVGSACFALGAVPAFVRRVGDDADAVVFFVGSIFFTVAGYAQYRQAGDAAAGPGSGGGRVSWYPADPDWQAAAIQSLGTVFFNVSTFRAMTEAFHRVSTVPAWRPDAFGSVAFLVSSGIAFAQARRHAGRWRDPGWWIAVLNLLGSVFFGLSAIGDYTIPATGQLENPALANGGTLLGGLCFLAGALLLPAGARPTGDGVSAAATG
jgi:hypothetical protein